MRYAFAKRHISELITDFFLDFYNNAIRVQSNYLFHIDKPKIDQTDEFFIDKMRRSYKEYAAFMMGETYFENCFSMKNIETIDFCLIKYNTKTKVNTMVTIHTCNSSQVITMVTYIHNCTKKYMATLALDNPNEVFFMGDITILVDQMRKNRKFLTNGKEEDIFQLCMRNYIDETRKKMSTTIIKLDAHELIRRWQVLKHSEHEEDKRYPSKKYYCYFRSPRYEARIKRLKGSLSG
jgi:hypothetical protein